MEKYAWKATLKEGKREEYIRRHNEIWQEMVDYLKAQVFATIPFGYRVTIFSVITSAKRE
jgi:hypothetical protein